jgi:enoyl-CoA hydratase/carnithine racemase
MTATRPDIIVEREQRITIITLNRPEALNALTAPMHEMLADAFDAFAADPEQWVAIVAGAGDRAFCAGSDLKAIARGEMPHDMPWSGGYAGLIERFDLTKPVIAAVDGVAMGGGFEIALACDLVIASERAIFGLPEPRAGVAAVGGGLHRLPRQIDYRRAMEIILAGRRVDAPTALDWGLVNEVTPPGGALDGARRWADAILALSPMAIRASKDAIQRGAAETSLADALANQANYPGLKAMRESDDYREGPRAFAEKRDPRWRGR